MPRQVNNDRSVTVRLPTDLVTRLDKHAVRMMRRTPGVIFTRADAMRVLLYDALDRAETAGAARDRRRKVDDEGAP
ncbi:MAG: hypothetical protein ABII82_13375 [Verrucomicrobiota bacterium]